MDFNIIYLIVSALIIIVNIIRVVMLKKKTLGDLIIFYDTESDSANLKFVFDTLDIDDLMKKKSVMLRIKNETFKNSHE